MHEDPRRESPEAAAGPGAATERARWRPRRGGLSRDGRRDRGRVGSITRAAWASVVPQDWQNVRVAGLAIPHDGQRIRPGARRGRPGPACSGGAADRPGSGGQIGSDGTMSGIPDAEGGAVAAGGGRLPAGPGRRRRNGGRTGSRRAVPPTRGTPRTTHRTGRPAMLADPQRRQMSWCRRSRAGLSRMTRTSGQIEEAQDHEARRNRRRLADEHRRSGLREGNAVDRVRLAARAAPFDRCGRPASGPGSCRRRR